jgi:hypothetical protein
MVLYILTFTFLDSRREGEAIINIYIYICIYISISNICLRYCIVSIYLYKETFVEETEGLKRHQTRNGNCKRT